MNAPTPFPLIAVDVGNSRLKLGMFEQPLTDPLPHPARAVSLKLTWTDADIDVFLPSRAADFHWLISSVNRPDAARLLDWLARHGVHRARQLAAADLPLAVALEHPDKVGMDRLCNAVAANRLRRPSEPAIVISMGSALTVDLVTAEGAFAGGAILPGIAMGARALHEFTDLLPLVELAETPPALGTSTVEAIRSGLYWGALGGVRELVAQLLPGERDPRMFLTGGAGPLFAEVLAAESERPPQFVPHLTLAGIALAAAAKGSR